ncbi:MAG: hypothetical protein WBA41_02590 [Rivularia sp. (in: cyanobacteria)]
MSKTATTNLVLPEHSQELIVSEPWTMETYADDLMDQLFADLDCVLDGSSNLSSQIVRAQQVTLDRASLPQLVAPSTTIGSIGDEQRRHQAQHTVANKPLKTTQRIKKPRRKIWRNLRQLLTVGAGMGLAIAAINWAISNGFLNRLTSTSMQFALQEPALQQKVLQPQSTAPTQAEIKSDLVDYMLGALTIIERQQDDLRDTATNNVAIATPVPANQTTLAYANQPVTNLPAPRIANNVKPSPTRTTSTRVVERIYIPVYQAPQPMRYAPPVVAQAPAPTPLPPVTTASIEVAPKPSDSKAKKPAPVKAAKTKPPEKIAAFASIREIKPLAVKTKPVNVRQAPEIPKMKEPAKVIAPQQTATSPAPQPKQKVASVPVSSHVLEGLLELGEQSAALFKVNGITRRIKLGENIGASGWTLVDVANGEAIIRRNGEVRSIFAGQKF